MVCLSWPGSVVTLGDEQYIPLLSPATEFYTTLVCPVPEQYTPLFFHSAHHDSGSQYRLYSDLCCLTNQTRLAKQLLLHMQPGQGLQGELVIVKNELIFVIYSRIIILSKIYLWLLVKSAVVDQVGPILDKYELCTKFNLVFSFNQSWRNKVFGTDESLVLVS